MRPAGCLGKGRRERGNRTGKTFCRWTMEWNREKSWKSRLVRFRSPNTSSSERRDSPSHRKALGTRFRGPRDEEPERDKWAGKNGTPRQNGEFSPIFLGYIKESLRKGLTRGPYCLEHLFCPPPAPRPSFSPSYDDGERRTERLDDGRKREEWDKEGLLQQLRSVFCAGSVEINNGGVAIDVARGCEKMRISSELYICHSTITRNYHVPSNVCEIMNNNFFFFEVKYVTRCYHWELVTYCGLVKKSTYFCTIYCWEFDCHRRLLLPVKNIYKGN